jgi:hypothetical protein
MFLFSPMNVCIFKVASNMLKNYTKIVLLIYVLISIYNRGSTNRSYYSHVAATASEPVLNVQEEPLY